jgi:hypothetical protein
MQKRMRGIPVLVDLELRLRIMDRYEGYAQVLTLASPPIEIVAGPDVSPDLARLANDSMAEIVSRHPDRFLGFVASLPMNNPDAAVAEIDRAIAQLHATGVQIFSNVNGRPLDGPEFEPICPSGSTPRALRPSPTTPVSSARNTICGGRSAGRTRPRSRWAGSCSMVSSIAIPSSR